MLGSFDDAEDLVQETLLRAWRGRAGFEGRAQFRTWLYRIATNVCLDALSERSRRARPIEEGPAGTVDDSLEERPRTHWLEPIHDARVIPADASPADVAMLRQSIRLAFVAALQHLPPRQRAALILAEVLGWSASEIAETLGTTVPAVNSALHRAALVDRYVSAFERYDMDALAALLRDDAILSMPPYTLWLRGTVSIRAWLLGRGAVCRGSRLVPTAACGAPAFGQYKPGAQGTFTPWSLIVLELAGDRIANITHFLDTQTLFPRFGLPQSLPA